jgi:hypothetical protein
MHLRIYAFASATSTDKDQVFFIYDVDSRLRGRNEQHITFSFIFKNQKPGPAVEAHYKCDE